MNHSKLCFLSFALSTLAVPEVAASPECIFPSSTLEVDYAQADAIVVAQAVGCAGAQLSENGACRNGYFSFDVVEVLKDSVPSPIHGGVFKGNGNMGCGRYFSTGHSYLLFIDKNGNLNQGAIRVLGGGYPHPVSTEERLQILRQYRDRIIGDLSEPWHFSDQGRVCIINHAFEDASLSFTYGGHADDESYFRSHKLERSDGPNGEIRLDTGPLVPEEASFHGEMRGPDYGRDAIILAVTLKNSVVALQGSVSIRVGYRVWPLHRKTIFIQAGNSTPVTIVTEVTGGDAAIEILDAMSEPTDLVISAVASGISPEVVDESPLRFETRTTQLPSAANKFKACVDGTQKQANPVLP